MAIMDQQSTEKRAAVPRGTGQRHAGCRLSLAIVAAATMLGCMTTDTQAPAIDSERAVAIRNVGTEHLSRGRTAMAIRKLQESMSLNAKDPVTHLWLAEAYRRKGMLDKAEAGLLEAIALNDDTTSHDYQETVLNLCALYIQMKKFSEARGQCNTLVEDPTFGSPWRALTNRGWAEFKIGLLDEARKSYKDALDFHPRYSSAHLNLGILEQRQKEFMLAMQHYEVALETGHLSPDGDAEVNYRIAEVYVALGNRSKAIEHFNVAVERSPYGNWATRSKSYLELLQ
jgi:Tfp pilus assembly protein PilF